MGAAAVVAVVVVVVVVVAVAVVVVVVVAAAAAVVEAAQAFEIPELWVGDQQVVVGSLWAVKAFGAAGEPSDLLVLRLLVPERGRAVFSPP